MLSEIFRRLDKFGVKVDSTIACKCNAVEVTVPIEIVLYPLLSPLEPTGTIPKERRAPQPLGQFAFNLYNLVRKLLKLRAESGQPGGLLCLLESGVSPLFAPNNFVSRQVWF